MGTQIAFFRPELFKPIKENLFPDLKVAKKLPQDFAFAYSVVTSEQFGVVPLKAGDSEE